MDDKPKQVNFMLQEKYKTAIKKATAESKLDNMSEWLMLMLDDVFGWTEREEFEDPVQN